MAGPDEIVAGSARASDLVETCKNPIAAVIATIDNQQVEAFFKCATHDRMSGLGLTSTVRTL
jgi:hypothetical protein